jgi:hypothetical protein
MKLEALEEDKENMKPPAQRRVDSNSLITMIDTSSKSHKQSSNRHKKPSMPPIAFNAGI